VRRILPLGNSQKEEISKFKPCQQEEHTGIWFWLKGIGERNLSLAQPHRILVLVKGDW
jgi:hypothetical protein